MDNTEQNNSQPQVVQGAQVPNPTNGMNKPPVGTEGPANNLKLQGDIIAQQKAEQQALKKQLEDQAAQNRLLQEQLNQLQQSPPPSTPQVDLSESIVKTYKEMEAFMEAQRQAQQAQAFEPIQQMLYQSNIPEAEQEGYLEQIKVKYGVDLVSNPNPQLLGMILTAENNHQPQTLPQGRGYTPTAFNFDVAQEQVKQEAVSNLVKQQVDAIKNRNGYK